MINVSAVDLVPLEFSVVAVEFLSSHSMLYQDWIIIITTQECVTIVILSRISASWLDAVE